LFLFTIVDVFRMYFLYKLSISASFHSQIIFEVTFFYRFALLKPLLKTVPLSSSTPVILWSKYRKDVFLQRKTFFIEERHPPSKNLVCL